MQARLVCCHDPGGRDQSLFRGNDLGACAACHGHEVAQFLVFVQRGQADVGASVFMAFRMRKSKDCTITRARNSVAIDGLQEQVRETFRQAACIADDLWKFSLQC